MDAKYGIIVENLLTGERRWRLGWECVILVIVKLKKDLHA